MIGGIVRYSGTMSQHTQSTTWILIYYARHGQLVFAFFTAGTH